MTIMELQNILGETINEIRSAQDEEESRKARLKAEFVAKIAKQMVNAADVVLRTDKMCGTTNRIDAIVGK